MKKLLIIFAILFFACNALAADNRAIREGALPTKSTFGADTLGGFTGGDPEKIYFINTLTKDTAAVGTTRNGYGDETEDVFTSGLKTALEATGSRIIVFEVSGVIEFDEAVVIGAGSVAVYGQTAPSPGIFLKGLTLISGGYDEVVFQHLRIGAFRYAETGSASDATDCMHVGSYTGSSCNGTAENVIIDHCTLLWSVDEIMEASCLDGLIISNCIFGEPLSRVAAPYTHTVGEHSKSLLISSNAAGGSVNNLLFANNLVISSVRRNIISNPGVSWAMVNSWFYNHRYEPAKIEMSSDRENTNVTLVGNVYESGLDTSSPKATDYFFFLKSDVSITSTYVDLFFEGNCVVPQGDISSASCQTSYDDYTLVRPDDVNVAGLTGGTGGTIDTQFSVDTAAGAQAITEVTPLGTYDATPATQVTNLSTLKSTILANVGARPVDRISVESRLIAAVQNSADTRIKNDIVESSPSSDEVTWPDATSDPGLFASTTRNTGTEMDDDGLPNFPANPFADDDSDSRDNLMEWIDLITVSVESPYTPPPERSNDPSGDTDCLAWYQFESDLTDSQNSEDLTGSEAGGVETEYLDGASEKYFGRYDDERYVGAVASRAYTNISEVVFELSQGGDVTNRTCYVGKATMSGEALDSITAWENQACANGLNTFTLDPVQSVADGEAILLYMDGNDTTDYPIFLYNATASQHDDLYGAWRWDEDKSKAWYDLSGEANIKISTTSATVSYYSLSPIEGTASVDLEATDTSFASRADASLPSTFPGKNGETNRIFSIAMVFNAESLPTSGNYMYLTGKEDVFAGSIYNDGGTPKMRLALGDGDMEQVYTHATEISADTTYAVVFGWTNTDNTAFIRLFKLTGSTWAVEGTAITDSGTDFDLAASANPFEVGAYSGASTFDGLIDDLGVFADELTAAQALSWASGEYGDPGPTISTAVVSTTGYTNANLGQRLTLTLTWGEATYVTGPPSINGDIGGIDIDFYYSSGSSGTEHIYLSDELTMDMNGTLTIDSASVVLNDGSIQGLQGEAATLTLPALTGTATVVMTPTGDRGVGFN